MILTDIPPGELAGSPLPLTPDEFHRIAAFAQREFGLALQESKKSVVEARLHRLLAEFGCNSANAFCERIESGNFPTETRALASALTTNVTSFFRETHHFDLLTEKILRPSLAQIRSGQRLRIWSAGCSAGHEPCSAAMQILDLLPEASRLNIRILATDIDPAIIAKARRNEYPEDEIRDLPASLQTRFTRAAAGKTFAMDDRVIGMIRYAELNLVSDWPIRGPFDAIFCRNVAIYFDKTTQARLWTRFATLLRPGGLLFIGHAERITGSALSSLTSDGITTYRRNTLPER